MQELKNLLIELGFHHSWGYWIFNTNSLYRIRLHRTRKMLYVDMTMKGNYWDMNDAIKISNKDIDYEFIMAQINNYFNG